MDFGVSHFRERQHDKPMMKITMPLISVIVPCYGQAHFLRDAVASVQTQSVTDWELLVIDDGSPDDTAEVTNALSASDSRIRLVRKSNGGLSSARNAGLAQMRGRFIQFLDADDLLLPGKFDGDLRLSHADANMLVIDDYQYLIPGGELRQDDRCAPRFRSSDAELELALRWELDLSIPIHAPLFPANVFAQNRLVFDEHLPNHEDFAMWLRVLAGPLAIKFSGRVGALYRTNPAGMTRNRQRMYEGYSLAIARRLADTDLREVVRDALRRKQRVVDHQYGHGPRATLRKWLMHPWIKGYLPWPMQQKLARTFLADPIEHQKELCKRFGVLPR